MIAPIKAIKRLFDRRVWAERSFERFAGSGTLGGDLQEFNPKVAVEQYKSWAYIAANIVARECAQHPLRLYVRDTGARMLFASRPVTKSRMAYLNGEGQCRPSIGVMQKAAEFGDQFVEVTEPHPAVTTLCNPNPFQTGFDQTVLRWVYLQLTGNAYLHPVAHIQLGTPESVWTMPPQFTRVVPNKSEFISGYTYGSDDTNLDFFNRDEVIHFKLPNPTDLYYGRGVLESIWSVWAIHGHKRTMDIAHFQNRARPDWIAAMGGGNEDSLKRFEEIIRGKVGGSKNAGNMVTVGTSDFSLHQLNFPPDVISDPDRVLDEIAGGFGVPRAMITGNQSIAGGGSERADATFLRGTIAPLLKSDEETLNNQWLPLFGLSIDDAFLAYDNPVPGDKQFDRDVMQANIATGRITINDANKLDGLDDVEGGDIPRVNGVPLDQVGAMPAAPAFTFSAPPTTNQFTLGPSSGIGGSQALPDSKTSLELPDPDAPFDTNVGRFLDKAFIKTTKVSAENDIRDDSENVGLRMSRQISAVFTQAEDAVLAGLSAGGAVAVDELLAQFEKDIFDATIEPITAASVAGANVGLDDIGVDRSVFDVTNPEVANSITRFNLRLAGEVTQATVTAVQDTIAQGVEAGESIDQLRQRVVDTGKFSPERAETIARTESARGFISGEETGWKESGIVTGKKWLLAPGACPYCVEAAKVFNARPKGTPLGQPFLNEGALVSPPGMTPMKINAFNQNGPLHPNDRCDIVAVLED